MPICDHEGSIGLFGITVRLSTSFTCVSSLCPPLSLMYPFLCVCPFPLPSVAVNTCSVHPHTGQGVLRRGGSMRGLAGRRNGRHQEIGNRFRQRGQQRFTDVHIFRAWDNGALQCPNAACQRHLLCFVAESKGEKGKLPAVSQSTLPYR